MSSREQAIEAAEDALFAQEASLGAGGTAWWQSATLAAETVVSALLPGLLNDLADRIERHAGPLNDQGVHVGVGAWGRQAAEGYTQAIGEVLDLVRAAAEGWGQDA